MLSPIIMTSYSVFLHICFEPNSFHVFFFTGLHDLEHPDVALADEW